MDEYIEQSAVIPYRIQAGEVQILLITSINSKRWIIPKGIIELNMTPQASAEKEALEEAGIRGEVFPDLLGVYTYNKWGGVCRVQVFLLRVEQILESWLEDFREREWVTISEAIQRVREVEIKEIFENLSIRD
jgi:8-oxo-dGTP pyrophosphatase MutT (NUDIX family)